jgi:hypothetical protein
MWILMYSPKNINIDCMNPCLYPRLAERYLKETVDIVPDTRRSVLEMITVGVQIVWLA